MLFAFCFLLFAFRVDAQVNYVRNPSFEQVDSCPVYLYKIKALYWDTLMNGGGFNPDLMTPCYVTPIISNVFGVPLNFSGRNYQQPRSGNNYHNFLLYKENRNIIDYIQGNLSKPLLKKNYCVIYYVNLSNNSRYAIDKIGAYLDDGSVRTPPGQTTVVATSVSSPGGVYLIDTLNWIKVQDVFSAKGNETKITIGNFNLINNTNTLIANPSAIDDYSYYFIDDISVVEADLPAYAGRDTVLCTGDSVFIGRPPEIGLECLWFNNALQIATGGGIWVKPATTQTYMVQQDVCGLIKRDTILVQVKPKYNGTPGLTTNTLNVCPTDTVKFNLQNQPAGNTIKYSWLPLSAFTNTGNLSAKALIQQSTTFTMNISSNGEDNFCPFLRTNMVTVIVPQYTVTPVLASNSIVVCPLDTIRLSLQNPPPGNVVKYLWFPVNVLTNTTNLTAKSLIQQTTTFTINISSAVKEIFCPFSRTNEITVVLADTCFKDPRIPNIFTPNNDDVNDQWKIIFPRGYLLQEMAIYNRWGTLIYERKNLSFNIEAFASITWDGRTTSGEECTAGVYFYILQYIDKNNLTKIVKGNLTLLK